uniref:G-protein coupled receptors family 2 profile 1 domain-containing protein n=1 Tax=Anas zonorhyncha TaxID=75864 RepID=A0A8B9UDG2_9AVES
MDVTISQFILEEFDVNCSLLDLQETVLESFSISFLGFHGPYCNATTDQIGTCWPRASAGKLVERPCPEFFNGIKYNTTSKYKLFFFSRRSGLEKAPREIQMIFSLKKKKKSAFLGINISSTFQPVYSKFLPGMLQISQKHRLLNTDSYFPQCV